MWLYIISLVMEAITTALWTIKMFSRAVFQGILVYVRFWKRVCTWKRIISLFKKKKRNTAGNVAVWKLGGWGGVVQVVADGLAVVVDWGLNGYMSILKILRSLLDTDFSKKSSLGK